MQFENNKPEFVKIEDRIEMPNFTPEEKMERLRIEIRNQVKYMRRHIKTLRRACHSGNMYKINEAGYNYNGTIYRLKKLLVEIKKFENPTPQVTDIISIAEETISTAWDELNK